MEKREFMHRFAQSKEEELLIGRLLDLARRAEKGYAVYSRFLNPHERAIAERTLRAAGINFRLEGGYREAERAILAFLPEYLQEAQEDPQLPVCLLSLQIKGSDFGKKLTHRDYLGSLMALRIEREMIGDILVQETGAYLFLLKQAAQVVLQELKKIGSHGVEIKELLLTQAEVVEAEKEELRVFVASMRLDTIVAEGFGLSRSQAAAQIESGLVSLRHCECMRPSAEVGEGDVISLKGSGRVTVGKVGGTSRKGRLCLSLYRWK